MDESLARSLTRIIVEARERAARGEQRGSVVYAELYAQAIRHIGQSGTRIKDVVAETPEMNDLKSLAKK